MGLEAPVMRFGVGWGIGGCFLKIIFVATILVRVEAMFGMGVGGGKGVFFGILYIHTFTKGWGGDFWGYAVPYDSRVYYNTYIHKCTIT